MNDDGPNWSLVLGSLALLVLGVVGLLADWGWQALLWRCLGAGLVGAGVGTVLGRVLQHGARPVRRRGVDLTVGDGDEVLRVVRRGTGDLSGKPARGGSGQLPHVDAAGGPGPGRRGGAPAAEGQAPRSGTGEFQPMDFERAARVVRRMDDA